MSKFGFDYDSELPLGIAEPAVFLSAGLQDPSGLSPERERREHAYLKPPSDPERVRRAVYQIARHLFASGFGVVFGGHPEITPIVLETARAAPGNTRVVAVFQSRFFESKIPPATYEMANWSRGALLWTPAAADRDESLRRMREDMIGALPYVGAVFAGGLSGVADEHDLFRQRWPVAPCFAVASTGGASGVLLKRHGAPTGTHVTRDVLESQRAYPVVARRIAADLRTP